jgi:hypothetical protein
MLRFSSLRFVARSCMIFSTNILRFIYGQTPMDISSFAVLLAHQWVHPMVES